MSNTQADPTDAEQLAVVAENVTLHEYPEMMHVWPVAPILEGRRALDEAVALINQHMTVS